MPNFGFYVQNTTISKFRITGNKITTQKFFQKTFGGPINQYSAEIFGFGFGSILRKLYIFLIFQGRILSNTFFIKFELEILFGTWRYCQNFKIMLRNIILSEFRKEENSKAYLPKNEVVT